MMISMRDKMKEVKREIIVEAAETLFFSQGYDNTSADEISQAAGISKSTLYTHFYGKEEILVRVFLKGALEYLKGYMDALEKEDTGFNRLLAYAVHSYNCHVQNPQYLDLYDITVRSLQKGVDLGKETREMVFSYKKKHRKILMEVLQAGIKDGTIRSDLKIDLSMEYFINTIQHIAKYIILSKFFDEEDFYTAVGYFLEGFKPK